MEWQMRIALIIGGFVLVGYIFYDFNKKRKIQKENERLKRQFTNLDEQSEHSDFDRDGVGQARPAIKDSNSDNKVSIEDKDLVEQKEKNIQPESSNNNQKKQAENKVENQTTKNLFEKQSAAHSQQPQLVLSLLLKAAQGEGYKGKDFLPIFLSQGLRHGEMGIFHRHQNSGAKPGPVYFSLANGIAPGTFSMDNIELFETPAMALFMTMPGPDDAQVAYNAMVKTIKLLKKELGGEIFDETQSIYTEQTHNHRLDQIQEFNRKMI